MNTNRDVELLYELGSLRFVQRAWSQFLNPGFANLAEHHFRVVWLALILSAMEKKGDQEKIIKMALVHDVSESRTGDAHFLSRMYVKRNEAEAVKDTFKDTVLEKEFTSLWNTYEKHNSIEAKIVKDADLLDVDLELFEQAARGSSHKQNWTSQRKLGAYKHLSTPSAKKLWKSIWKSNPLSWYNNGKNRFNSGDWKPKHN